jgi:hypothetical protein
MQSKDEGERRIELEYVRTDDADYRLEEIIKFLLQINPKSS